MQSSGKRLSIILASYNDMRIASAIESVRYFDDCGAVRLIIVDGSSRHEVKDTIAQLLTPDDVFISEPDKGIFDGLNKGLDRCDTDFVGWLGSDDRFTGQVMASQVIRILEQHDLFIANVAFFRGARVRRMTYSLPSRFGLVKYGFHNPHYATFGSASLLKSERFDLSLQGSDIDYFHKIFSHKPVVATTNAISTLQFDGGYSNSSYRKILRINWQLLSTYSKHTCALVAPMLLLLKLGYKAATVCYFKLFPMELGQVEVRAFRANTKPSA